MSRYYQKKEDIPKLGRLLAVSRYTYSNLRQLLNAGEELVGLFDNGLYKSAPFLDSQREFDYFHNKTNEGIFVGEVFYAIPKEETYAI